MPKPIQHLRETLILELLLSHHFIICHICILLENVNNRFGFHSRLREHSTTNHVYQDTSIYKLEQKIAALRTNIIEALAKPRSWEGQRPRCPRFAATRATRTLPLPGSPTSFHPIQTLLTPIATPIFTHDRRLRVGIPKHAPQYSKTHPTVSTVSPVTFPDAKH